MANKKTEVLKSPCNFMLPMADIGKLDEAAIRLKTTRTEILRRLLTFISKLK